MRRFLDEPRIVGELERLDEVRLEAALVRTAPYSAPSDVHSENGATLFFDAHVELLRPHCLREGIPKLGQVGQATNVAWDVWESFVAAGRSV